VREIEGEAVARLVVREGVVVVEGGRRRERTRITVGPDLNEKYGT